jgi:AraC family transcriptional regulator of adaptative response / DNA-3-methyladenine glycosylase II
LDHDACYAAVQRRDARFDGRFYTAVTSTGVFCRPSCPARTPRSANVRFFTHAAAASTAGFRPCRRCRPELAPGHPEWNRRADLVGKALSLIEDGVVDDEGVSGLADRLGVSERHLRRELNAAVGTGPTQLARTRRLWLARMMLDQTSLAITDVAFASGFSSVRQFNDAFRQTFDATPTELRRRPGGARSGATEVTLSLGCRGPLRWDGLHRFLAARAIDGLEQVDGDRFRRGVPGGAVEFGPTADGDALELRCRLDRLDRVSSIIPLIRRVADLDTDLDPIADHLGRHPELAQRLSTVPLPRLPGAFDPFELAVRAVLGQQVSVAAARTTLSKLVALVPPSTETTDEQLRAGFPTPAEILAAPLDQLGVPSRRRDTVAALAEAMDQGRIDLSPAADRDTAEAALLQVPGIGPWTAGYIAMRALGDPDGWPTGDLVLRNALGVDPTELDRRATRWQPWRAYAALVLWSSPTPASNPNRK